MDFDQDYLKALAEQKEADERAQSRNTIATIGDALASMTSASSIAAGIAPKQSTALQGLAEAAAKQDSPLARYKQTLENYKLAREGSALKTKEELAPQELALRNRELDVKDRYNSIISRLRQQSAEQKDGPKQLPADKVISVNEGAAIPAMLGDIKNTIEKNPENFGRMNSALDFASNLIGQNEKTAVMDSQMKSTAQAFGKYMEGGVLRKEDEEKYQKMFPERSDTPEVARSKIANVERLLATRHNSTVEALAQSGYDTKGIRSGIQVPDAPAILAGKGNKKAIVKRQRNPAKPGMVRYVYSDGTTEDVQESSTAQR